MALNSTVIAAINSAAVLLSVPVIAAGVWLSTQADNACVKLIQWPIIVLRIVVLAMALAGFVGAFWRIPGLLLVYLATMVILILALAGLVVFIFAVTSGGGGGAHLAPSQMFFEYELDDYSGWLRRQVEGSERWNQIKACLSSTSTCSELNQTYTLAQDFFNAELSPLQSGCCKPPTRCGYTLVNPTYWISPIDTVSNIDCVLWSNDQAQLWLLLLLLQGRPARQPAARVAPRRPTRSSGGTSRDIHSMQFYPSRTSTSTSTGTGTSISALT